MAVSPNGRGRGSDGGAIRHRRGRRSPDAARRSSGRSAGARGEPGPGALRARTKLPWKARRAGRGGGPASGSAGGTIPAPFAAAPPARPRERAAPGPASGQAATPGRQPRSARRGEASIVQRHGPRGAGWIRSTLVSAAWRRRHRRQRAGSAGREGPVPAGCGGLELPGLELCPRAGGPAPALRVGHRPFGEARREDWDGPAVAGLRLLGHQLPRRPSVPPACPTGRGDPGNPGPPVRSTSRACRGPPCRSGCRRTPARS